MALSDKAIIDLLKSDYDEGIKALFIRYYKPLVLFSKEYVGDINVAEDIVQELFIRLWDNKRLLTIPAAGLSSYLFTSVMNKSKTVLDRTKRSGEISDKIAAYYYFYPADIIDEELFHRIAEELDRLPERIRSAVELVMVQGMKYQEAADTLNISINTLKSSLKEGLRRLRATFNGADFLILFAILLAI